MITYNVIGQSNLRKKNQLMFILKFSKQNINVKTLLFIERHKKKLLKVFSHRTCMNEHFVS